MRDIMWLTMWNDHDHRRAMYQRGEFGNAGPNGGARGLHHIAYHCSLCHPVCTPSESAS
jgi:hypothetical protein